MSLNVNSRELSRRGSGFQFLKLVAEINTVNNELSTENPHSSPAIAQKVLSLLITTLKQGLFLGGG